MANSAKDQSGLAPAADLPPFSRKEISSWADFHQTIEPYLDGKHLFRGVSSVKHLLVPSVGRTSETWSYSLDLERTLLEQFKREAVPYLKFGIDHDDDWAWLALAQHHGVPTRLLDWSESPYVALFFAAWSNDALDAGVYVIDRPAAVETFASSPFEVTKDGFFYPRHVTARITAQSGLFTIQHEPSKRYSGSDVVQFTIKAAAKPEIRQKLDAIGMHDALVYADLDGLSRRLKALHGARMSEAAAAPPVTGLSPAAVRRFDPDDPQKYRWGEKSEREGWKLSAKVDPDSSDQWFRVVLSVSGAAGKKLTSPVTFHLHDTFERSVREIKPKNGEAELKLWSYGAFTVGAVIVDDKVALELDLANLPDAPKKFRER